MAFALHAAARAGDVEELRRLLASGCDPKEKDLHKRTPLHLAAWAGQEECVQALIDAGADMNATAQDDTTAMHLAATKGRTEACRLLVKAGVKVNVKNRKGANALHLAAQHGHLELVTFLLNRKANTAAKNKKNQTAWDLASDPAIKAALESAVAAQPAVDASKQQAKKDRGHVRRRDDMEEEGSHAASSVPVRPGLMPESADGPAGHEQLPGDVAPKAKRVVLSHLGEEEDDDHG